MLNKAKQQILKHNLENNIVLKYEYKNLILKSIIHNRNLDNKLRLFSKLSVKKNYRKRNKKICLLTGKSKSVYNKFNLTRGSLNYFCKLGILQNFKIKSW